jgi:hypothetical protein
MQTTYFALIVVAELTTGGFYIGKATPVFPYLELCQMWEERAKKEYRPRPNIKKLITICNPVKIVGGEDLE